MRVGLYWCLRNNFGDALNATMVVDLFPQVKQMMDPNIDRVMLAVGSVLGTKQQHDHHPWTPRVVWGTGYMYEAPRELPADSKVYCVRGLYTCDRYNLDGRLAVADPAILTPFVWPRSVQPSKSELVVYKWDYKEELGEDETTSRLDETGVEGFLARLWQYERIVTDSMHAAIAADAYGIPWRPMRWEPKWMDHFAQVGIANRPREFALSSRELLGLRAMQLLGLVGQIKEELWPES